jgi:hypothetical protein
MNSEDRLLIIKNIISNHSNIKFDNFSKNLRVLEDFGIAGDDAEEFIIDFSLTLNVDVSELKFDEYFPKEATADMHYQLSLLGSKNGNSKVYRCLSYFESIFWGFFSSRKSYKVVTVGDLFEFSNKGKWSLD